jgi:adenylate cyclase
MNALHVIPALMVANITGNASLHQHLDPQEIERTLESCRKHMMAALASTDGEFLQQTGDELLVRFASVDAAVHAAVDMQQQISALPPVSGHKLTLRIALHDCNAHGPQLPDPIKRNSLMRIAGFAKGEQILCSAAIAAMLADSTTVIPTQARPELGELHEGTQGFSLYQLLWSAHSLIPRQAPRAPALVRPLKSVRLHLRYHGKDFVVDDKSPVFTMGRDPACNLLVEDRKASRAHARIEHRANGFYLVDTSTNGSFVSMAANAETLVRRDEILLTGKGLICFGSSANDPAAERVAFELR